MEADIFKAAIPEPLRIFGLKLKVFSIGRYQRLKRFNCAFVADDEANASIEDLLTGILVCSMRCRDFDALIDGPDFDREVKRWGKHIRKEIRAEGFNVFEKFGLFKRYIDDAQRIPEFWNESDDSEPSGSHWSHGMEVILRSELGWTREEIDERPFSKAIFDWLKWAENQGAVRIMTDFETTQAESNAQAFEALMKGVQCQASN